jgi:hypothetical protein
LAAGAVGGVAEELGRVGVQCQVVAADAPDAALEEYILDAVLQQPA